MARLFESLRGTGRRPYPFYDREDIPKQLRDVLSLFYAVCPGERRSVQMASPGFPPASAGPRNHAAKGGPAFLLHSSNVPLSITTGSRFPFTLIGAPCIISAAVL